MSAVPFQENLRDLVSGIDVIISDIWGVVHDGIVSFPDAYNALREFRNSGGTVVMLTNAPRPAASVQAQLRALKVPDDTYDAIVSSGDLTRHYVASRPGERVFQIGPGRDSPIFDGLDVDFAELSEAHYIVCTGLVDDETETAEHYREMMLQARARQLTMVCANPDIIVERGDKLIYCAGAIAELYAELGGDVIWYGKPHPPAYKRAIEIASGVRGTTLSAQRMIAIGDSVRTDLAGAHAMGIPCLFVTRGIHSSDFADIEEIDDLTTKRLFGNVTPPLALTRHLKW